MERRLAAILAADVVGYTRLMGADEAGTLRRLTELRQEVIEPLIAAHQGRVVKLMGDGLLVEFASVVAAVDCAIAWQHRVGEQSADTPESQRLRFRIGINLGDVIVADADLYGDGVNIAARLEALAEPGGICLSEDAQRQARGRVAASFRDLGAQALKNVAEPVRAFRVLTDDMATQSAAPASAGAALGRPTLALKPFRHLGDPAQAFAGGGPVILRAGQMTEDAKVLTGLFRRLFRSPIPVSEAYDQCMIQH